MPRRNGRQGGGGIVGLITKGVGLAAEYNEHRKERNLALENSRQNTPESVHDGPSNAPRRAATPRISEPEASQSDAPPPTYDMAVSQPRARSVSPGGPVMDEKKGAASRSDEYDSSSEEDLLEDDEDAWELDEAFERTESNNPPSYEQSEDGARSRDDLVQDVLRTHHSVAHPSQTRQPLPCPVIIPQRRPGSKKRGFVRAYAPVLETRGIDQDTFLQFLKNFHKSSQASPIFAVVQVSAMIAGLAPSVIAMAVTTAVQIGAQAGREIQGRQRTNVFLNRINEELFKPAGLFAMIMTYKPDAPAGAASGLAARFGVQARNVDLSTNQSIAKYAGAGDADRGFKGRMSDLRISSGTTRGAVALPEAAPLIFPDVDYAMSTEGGQETFKDKAKDAQKFLAAYFDRRAQLNYADSDPQSYLALPDEQTKMKSKLADPNHPIHQGGLVNVLSGGRLSSRGQGGPRDDYDRDDEYDDGQQWRRGGRRGGGRRGGGGLIGGVVSAAMAAANSGRDAPGPSSYNGARSREYEDDYASAPGRRDRRDRSRRHRRSFDDRSSYDNRGASSDRRAYPSTRSRGQGRGKSGGGIVQKLMKEDLLYLMIVNLPSEAELREAREELGIS